MKQIHSYVRTVLKSKGGRCDYNTVADVVSEALNGAISKNVSHDDPKFKGFLFICCLRSIQRNGKARKFDSVAKACSKQSHEPSALDNLIHAEEMDRVRAEINKLPKFLRDTMLLFLKGKDAYESAELRGVNPQTIRKDRCRALHILRAQLTQST